jgi:hypothetical protein
MQLFTHQTVEAAGAKLTEDNRHQAVHMAGPAGTIALATDGYVEGKMQEAIVKRTLEVARLAAVVEKITSDGDLSAQGKTNQLRSIEADRLKLADRLAADARQIDDVALVARLAEENLYQPEPIERGDVDMALSDREIRDYWASMTPSETAVAIENGELTTRHLEALRRSPIPLRVALAQIVDARWEAHLIASSPERFQSVQDDRSSAAWGVSAINQLRGAVERLAYHDADKVMATMQGRQVIRPATEARAA